MTRVELPKVVVSADPVTKLNCALIQADTRWADPEANRDHLARLMDTAPGAALYVLPETCTTGFLGDRDRNVARDAAGDMSWLAAQAQHRDAAIACSIAAAEGSRIFNRFLFAMPDGSVVVYDKRHLFAFGGETGARYAAGSKRVRAGFRGLRFDLQVCYDLRFPVWCRNDDGFDVQIFVANWPRARATAWQTLLAARAIENQAIVIGLNRVGIDGNGVDHPGCSGVWDAFGNPLIGPLDDSEQVAVVELDFDRLRQIRQDFPFLRDRDRYAIG